MRIGPSMYSLLVHDPDDVLTALAYTAYKSHELEVMRAIASETGLPPTQGDIDAFYRVSSSPTMLAMYVRQAEALTKTFLDEALKSRKSALEADFVSTAVGRRLIAIERKLVEKRSVRGWCADVGANLAVNFVTILVIAALLFGFQGLDRMLGTLGRDSGILGPGAQESAHKAQ